MSCATPTLIVSRNLCARSPMCVSCPCPLKKLTSRWMQIFQVHILLPPLSKLRTVVERLRPLAEEGIHFRANYSGELQLSTSTENARMEIGWSGLTNPPMCKCRTDLWTTAYDSTLVNPTQQPGTLMALRIPVTLKTRI